jgi:two-component system sensor histidine kinase CreC
VVPFHRRLWLRVLFANVLILAVPYFALRVARTYERHLLALMEEGLVQQGRAVAAALTPGAGQPFDPAPARALFDRMEERWSLPRVRVVTAGGMLAADSQVEKPGAYRERPADASLLLRPEVRAALEGRYGAGARLDPGNKNMVLHIALPVRADGAVAAAVCLSQPTTRVMAALRAFKDLARLVFILSGALALIVTALLAWSVTQPIGALVRRSEAVAAGDWDTDLDLGRHSEIGALSSAFQAMKERLREHLAGTRRLALDLAHRFKTPLTSIRGAVDILEELNETDPAARARFLANIRQDADRMNDLLNRLLLLARAEDPEGDGGEAVDLAALVRGTAGRFVPAAQAKGTTLALEVPSDPIPFRGIPDLLEKALENLLDNALHFTPAGGTVRVTLRPDGKALEIAVADSGPGVPETDRERIFVRFHTTRPGGNGLGLAIARAAAQRHGGTLELSARRGPGAVFVVRLPHAD